MIRCIAHSLAVSVGTSDRVDRPRASGRHRGPACRTASSTTRRAAELGQPSLPSCPERGESLNLVIEVSRLGAPDPVLVNDSASFAFDDVLYCGSDRSA